VYDCIWWMWYYIILYIYSIYIHNLIHMHKHYFSVWITHCIPLGCQLLMTQHHLYREMLLGRCIKEGEGESHGHCATSEWPCSTSKTSTGGDGSSVCSLNFFDGWQTRINMTNISTSVSFFEGCLKCWSVPRRIWRLN
jgi:hypothetical protein